MIASEPGGILHKAAQQPRRADNGLAGLCGTYTDAGHVLTPCSRTDTDSPLDADSGGTCRHTMHTPRCRQRPRTASSSEQQHRTATRVAGPPAVRQSTYYTPYPGEFRGYPLRGWPTGGGGEGNPPSLRKSSFGLVRRILIWGPLLSNIS